MTAGVDILVLGTGSFAGRILCDIGVGRAPASFAYEDERVFAIISSEQPTPTRCR